MNPLPNPGTYTARRNAPIVIEAKESGALLAWIPYILCSGEVRHTGKHCECIGQKDGTLKIKSVQSLRTIFNWDGLNPFDLEQIPIPDGDAPEFELADCFHDDSYQPEGAEAPIVQFKASWLNPIGGTQNMPAALSPEDRKAALTKWSSKFKAASGGKAPTAAKPQPAAAAAVATKPAAAHAGPPSRRSNATSAAARTMTQEEVWDAYDKAHPKKSQDDKGTEFYAAQDKLFPGANGELTIQQWGQVATELGL